MKQRQVQHRALPEDYPTLLPEVVIPAKPTRDGQGQQLCLISADLAERADQIVRVSLAATKPSATPTKGAAKSVVAKDPQGTEIAVGVHGPHCVCNHVVAIICIRESR